MRLQVLLAILTVSAAAGAAAGERPGQAGSDERRQWCAANLTACTEIARKPGFLGGPLNFCTEAADAKDCIGICELKWGEASPCLTAADPK